MTEKLKCVYSLMAKTVLIKIILTVINYITEFSNYSWSHRTLCFYLAHKDVSTITNSNKYSIETKYNSYLLKNVCSLIIVHFTEEEFVTKGR